jgi:hypothetical protein
MIRRTLDKIGLYANVSTGLLVILMIALIVASVYIRFSTIIVLEGAPQNILINNYDGQVEFDTRQISIDKGILVNRDSLQFYVNGNRYVAEPGELRIEYNSYKNYSDNNGLIFNTLSSKQHNMNFGTTAVSENMRADSISIKAGDNLLEYFHSKVIEAAGGEDNGKIITLSIENPVSNALLQIQNDEDLTLSGGCTVYCGEKVIGEDFIELEIKDNPHSCAFVLFNTSKMDAFLNETGGMVLNGSISSICGKLDTGDGTILSTSPATQKVFKVGSQEVELSGRDMKLEYTFNDGESILNAKGRAKNARLENVRIIGGVVQFFLTNSAALILAIIGGVISKSLSNVKRAKE